LTPKRSRDAKLRMYISRSFDINKPGTPIEKLKGGILGGSIISGELHVGDKIEIRPGLSKKEGAVPIPFTCEAKKIMEEAEVIETALPGGLLAVGTTLDPALTKSDSFVGSMIGHPGELPSAISELQIKHELLKRNDLPTAPLKPGDPIVVNVHTVTGVGAIATIGKKGLLIIRLKKPIVVDSGMRVALSRRVGQRWRLSGWGTVV
ncbi:MAG: translation initiation factor IF-2 subunit gamma, partial [Candidatus Micrarchaeota archaeon]